VKLFTFDQHYDLEDGIDLDRDLDRVIPFPRVYISHMQSDKLFWRNSCLKFVYWGQSRWCTEIIVKCVIIDRFHKLLHISLPDLCPLLLENLHS